MLNDKELRELADLFISLVNKYEAFEKTPRHYGTTELLYGSE